MLSYQTTFILTKAYLEESYDESLPHGPGARPNYLFPIALFAGGVGLLKFTDQPEIAGWALLALCGLELLHIRFRRGWWLFRQTWGKNRNLEVTLTIDDAGLETSSAAARSRVAWEDIDSVIETEAGVILGLKTGGRQYLSKSIIREDWLEKILAISDGLRS